MATVEIEISADEIPKNFWAQTNNRGGEITATRSWLVGAKRGSLSLVEVGRSSIEVRRNFADLDPAVNGSKRTKAWVVVSS